MNFKQYSENGINFFKINNGIIETVFSDLGAAIYSINFNGKNMLMTPFNSEVFLSDNIYHGKTVGRAANRIKGNQIDIDGNVFSIKNNEGENTLHGGINGISTKIFKSEIKESSSGIKIIFKYSSKDKESGFPGTLKVKVTYIIRDGSNKIKVLFDAKTTKSTYCDLTNHSYFSLGSENLDDLSLKINASNFLVCEEQTLLPIKKENVYRELDFTKAKRITRYLHSKKIEHGKANGYDHYFYFDNINKKPQIILKNSEILLKIRTDMQGVQIYSDNYSDEIKWIGTSSLKNRSIAIEPMDDYLNRKILRPGDKYKRYIQYEFIKRKGN